MPKFERRRALLSGMAASAAMHSIGVRAQPAGWPSKPLRIICATSAGGLTDAYARIYAELFTAKYKLPATVENRPGGSGIIATQALLETPADGHTVLLASTGTFWQLRVLYPKLPYDLDKDLVPVFVYPTGPLVVTAHEKTGIRDIKGLIEYARQNRTTMGNYVNGSYQQVFAERLNRDHGCKIEMVHYKGEVPMWTDMASGQLDVAIGSYLANQAVKDRGIRTIAVTGRVRSPRLPDVPTLIEQGLTSPAGTLEAAVPMVTRAGVPDAIIDALAQLQVEGNDHPKSIAMRENYAIPVVTKGRAEAQRMWREDAPLWIREVQSLGLKVS